MTAVLIQRQTGGDLSEVLGNISGMIRQRIRLQQHVKAKTAEGRFTGYILSAFPAVMFVIAYSLNPDYAGVLIRTNTGLMLLGIAFGLQMMGLYLHQEDHDGESSESLDQPITNARQVVSWNNKQWFYLCVAGMVGAAVFR